MSLYGYARVSTLDEDLGIQRAALKAAGCKVIRAVKASDTHRDGRTELQVLLDVRQLLSPSAPPQRHLRPALGCRSSYRRWRGRHARVPQRLCERVDGVLAIVQDKESVAAG